jgi:hypothetical protein
MQITLDRHSPILQYQCLKIASFPTHLIFRYYLPLYHLSAYDSGSTKVRKCDTSRKSTATCTQQIMSEFINFKSQL